MREIIKILMQYNEQSIFFKQNLFLLCVNLAGCLLLWYILKDFFYIVANDSCFHLSLNRCFYLVALWVLFHM